MENEREIERAISGTLWLVDGFNVLHAGILKGRERRGWREEPARRRLIEVVLGFHSQEPYELRVVFDGQGQDETHQGRSGNPIRVVFGGDADSFIVRAVKEHPPERIVVVSSDRLLCRRARGAGAEILSPMTFLSRCREG